MFHKTRRMYYERQITKQSNHNLGNNTYGLDNNPQTSITINNSGNITADAGLKNQIIHEQYTLTGQN